MLQSQSDPTAALTCRKNTHATLLLSGSLERQGDLTGIVLALDTLKWGFWQGLGLHFQTYFDTQFGMAEGRGFSPGLSNVGPTVPPSVTLISQA